MAVGVFALLVTCMLHMNVAFELMSSLCQMLFSLLLPQGEVKFCIKSRKKKCEINKSCVHVGGVCLRC